MKFAIRFGEKAAATSAWRPNSETLLAWPWSYPGHGEIFNAESLIAMAAASAAAHFRHLLVFRMHFPQLQPHQRGNTTGQNRTWPALGWHHQILCPGIYSHCLQSRGALGPACQVVARTQYARMRTHFRCDPPLSGQELNKCLIGRSSSLQPRFRHFYVNSVLFPKLLLNQTD